MTKDTVRKSVGREGELIMPGIHPKPIPAVMEDQK
jgi:hypothetical protein